jgi:dATP pyrophosphohydrolase
MLHYKQPFSVLVVIYTQNLQVLLLQRTDAPDAWQSVTGSLEAGETPQQTALREVYEETGLRIAADALEDWQKINHYEIFMRWRFRYAPHITHNTEHVFAVCLTNTCPITLAENEHVRYAWMDWQEAKERVFSPSNAEAIQTLPSKIQHKQP